MGAFKDIENEELVEVAATVTEHSNEESDAIEKLHAVDQSQAIIEFTLDGTIITANSNFLNTIGYSLSEVQGQHHSMFVEPNYRTSPEYQQFWAKLNRGEFDSGEYKQIGKGGREVWIQATYHPIKNAEGRFHKVVEFATDITEQKQLAANDADNARVKAALDVATSSVMMADAENIVIYANESVMNMLRAAESDIRKDLPNFTAASVIGSNIDSFHKNPAHQRGMIAALQSTYRTQIEVGGRTFALVANPVFDTGHERVATVVEWEDISEQLAAEEAERARAEEERALAMKNARIRSALDNVSSNVMMADAENVIVYANPAVLNMLRVAEADIRQVLPNFSADNVVGSNIDIFHRNPAHQRSMVSSLRAEYRSEIEVGVRTFSLIANPVFDSDGERLGTVVEWNDRTAELTFEETVDSTISSAVAGELGNRIDLSGREGFIAKVAKGMNQLLDIFENVLSDTAASISEMAEGRLTRKIDTEYEGRYDSVKADVNQTIDKLVEVVSEISTSSVSVKEAAGEISSGNTNLSQRTEEQAASLEETSAAMEEITTTVQQNAANASQANTLARGARETAENGGAVVGRAVSAMQAISESSNKINDIIGVIDEIAFQTNLLALNAAVEAARAGDQGRGFAVVADEVRNLAGRSATAAKEIKDLIKDSGEKVKEGSDLVNKSGETLEEIVTAVKKVNDIVAEISTASDEQATGLEEINKAIGEMDEMTQQNAALVEEAAAASEAMGNQAENLDSLISFFDTGTAQSSSSPARVEPKPVQEVSKPASVDKPARPAPAASTNDDGKDWSEF